MDPKKLKDINSSSQENKNYLLFMTFSISIGGFLFGYNTSIVGGANLYIQQEWNSSPLQLEIIVSATILGAAIGSLLGGSMADNFGRKPLIMIADVFLTVGSIIIYFFTSFEEIEINLLIIILGRFIEGIGVGMMAAICPVYLAESSPPHRRGAIVTANILLTTTAQFLCYVIALMLAPNWRAMFFLAAFPSSIQFGIMYFYLPETPKFLIKKNKNDEAYKVIARLRFKDQNNISNQDQQEILQEIKSTNQAASQESQDLTYIESLQQLFKTAKKQVIIACALQAFQQLNGINTALYYGPQIIQQVGFDDSQTKALWLSLPISGTNLLGTIINIKYIDNYGRRYILLLIIPFQIASTMTLAFGFFFVNYTQISSIGNILSLLGLICFVFFFALAMGTVPWTINSEIFPLQFRGIGNSLATSTNWCFNLFVSMTFLLISSSKFGQVIVWIILSSIAVVTWIFINKNVPETKNKTLEQIIELLKEDKLDLSTDQNTLKPSISIQMNRIQEAADSSDIQFNYQSQEENKVGAKRYLNLNSEENLENNKEQKY